MINGFPGLDVQTGIGFHRYGPDIIGILDMDKGTDYLLSDIGFSILDARY